MSQVATPVPTTVETSAPIGGRTQQVLLIIGVVLVITFVLGGGIYLWRWWLANRW